MSEGVWMVSEWCLGCLDKYLSMLARSAHLQIFATKNTVFYNCKFLQQKRRFTIASVCSPALALTALH